MFIANKLAILGAFTIIWTAPVYAEPIQVRPLQAIIDEDRIIGFTSTDPDVEFTAPDMWQLKTNGVIKRHLDQQLFEVILQVEPSYGSAKVRTAELIRQGIFKVFLPMPIHLQDAQLYVPDVLGELKAAFVPYPGNQQTNFYFRLHLDADQLQTLFRLSRQGLSLLGEVRFRLTLDTFQTDTTVPIQVSINPGLLDAAYAKDHPWTRYLKSDNGQQGGLSGNGLCDGGELCVFQQLSTGKLWVPVLGPRKNRDEWQAYCQDLAKLGYPGMSLPTRSDMDAALGEGLWQKMHQYMFPNAVWWGTRTMTPVDQTGNSYWINIDSGNTFPLHDRSNQSDRSICVSL